MFQRAEAMLSRSQVEEIAFNQAGLFFDVVTETVKKRGKCAGGFILLVEKLGGSFPY